MSFENRYMSHSMHEIFNRNGMLPEAELIALHMFTPPQVTPPVPFTLDAMLTGDATAH